jgi:hypothetical protein
MALAQMKETRTTTVRIPRLIYDQAKCVVENEKDGSGPVVSMNDLVVYALQAYLKLYRRRQIDQAFSGMAEDVEYQKEASLLSEEFADSDWEALRTGEESLEAELSYATSLSR